MLKLSTIKVQSFVTQLNPEQERTIQGGYTNDNCTGERTLPPICPTVPFAPIPTGDKECCTKHG